MGLFKRKEKNIKAAIREGAALIEKQAAGIEADFNVLRGAAENAKDAVSDLQQIETHFRALEATDLRVEQLFEKMVPVMEKAEGKLYTMNNEKAREFKLEVEAMLREAGDLAENAENALTAAVGEYGKLEKFENAVIKRVNATFRATRKERKRNKKRVRRCQDIKKAAHQILDQVEAHMFVPDTGRKKLPKERERLLASTPRAQRALGRSR